MNHTHEPPLYSSRMEQMPRSCVRDLMASCAQPGLIAFSGGVPAPSCIPLDLLRHSCDQVLAQYGSSALAYGSSEGEMRLREWIAFNWLPRQGIAAHPDEILIVNGSQQALDLLGKVLLDKGAPVAVENPTYLAALQAFAASEPEFRTVSMDREGPLPDSLARALRGPSATRAEGARLFYTVPNFQNPSGTLCGRKRRLAIAEELNRHPALLIEDDPYGELYYEEAPPPSLHALGAKSGALLGTFSKMVAPGLRLGFVWAPGPLARHLGTVKQAADLCSGRLVQLVLAQTLESLDMETHLSGLREHYRGLRDSMDQALRRHLGSLATWDTPRGGMFFWLRCAEHVDSRALLSRCAKKGVTFADGASFFAQGGGQNYMRLNFTATSPAQMEEGLAILANELRAS